MLCIMQRQQRGSAVDEGENVRQDGFALQSQRRLCFRFVYNSSPVLSPRSSFYSTLRAYVNIVFPVSITLVV